MSPNTSVATRRPEATAAAVVQRAKQCRDCGRDIEADRIYCQADRERRRALTFLEQAYRVLNPVDRLVPWPTARTKVIQAIEELTR